MIECPNCKKPISDKAFKCPYCQYELIAKKQYCTECGAKLNDGALICNNCGHPVYYSQDNTAIVNTQNSQTQPVELTGVKINKKTKNKIILISSIVVVILVVSILGFFSFSNYKEKKYEEDLNLITLSMLSYSSKIENCGNLINNVWRNAIYEKRDSETDKYTRPKGSFVSDFNDALRNLYNDSTFSSSVEDISDGMSFLESQVKELMNPPKKYEEAYAALMDYYNTFIDFANCVINPTGSLSTYSSEFSELDSEVLNCYKKMQLYVN